MTTRPDLHEAVAGQKSKASEYNENFTLLMGYVDDSVTESKDYVNNYVSSYMPSQTGNSGKFLSTNGTSASWTSLTSTFDGKANTNLDNITATASKKFDGQWVQANNILGTSTSKSTYTCSLASILPSDSYKYEVIINIYLYCNNDNTNARVRISSDIWQATELNAYSSQALAGGYGRNCTNTFVIPVGTGRTISYQVYNSAADSLLIEMWGYRRIGTNT